MSSQTGSPEGASALCGSESPSASATTCDVAAVPRNWQPPPGVPQARQPSSAASSRVMRPCANRAPIVCTLPASSPPSAGSVTPPGTMTPGRSRAAREREHRRGQALVAGRDAHHARAPRQRADQPPHHRSRRRCGTAGCPTCPACPGCGRRRDRCKRRRRAGRPRRASSRRGPHQQADLPVAGVVAERDRRAVLPAQPALRAEDQVRRAPDLGGVPAHAGVLGHAEQVAARLAQQHLGGDRQPPGRPGRLRARRANSSPPPEMSTSARPGVDAHVHPATSPCVHSPSIEPPHRAGRVLVASSGGRRCGRTLS